jgi:hypothetical protein
MDEIAWSVAREAMDASAELGLAWSRRSMSIIIKCDRNDLRLRLYKHFVEDRSIDPTGRDAEYTDKIGVLYFPDDLKVYWCAKYKRQHQNFQITLLL